MRLATCKTLAGQPSMSILYQATFARSELVAPGPTRLRNGRRSCPALRPWPEELPLPCCLLQRLPSRGCEAANLTVAWLPRWATHRPRRRFTRTRFPS